MVDSCSDLSALPIDLAKPETKMFKTFKGPTSNANISCVGCVNLVLNLGFSKQFSWKFAVCKSVNNMMNESVDIDDEPPTVQLSSTKSCSKNSSKNRFNALLSRFPSLTAPFQPNFKPKHSVRHHIHTNGPPIYSGPRRLSPEMLKVVKAEFDTLRKQGIVSRSNSNWASPLHLVKKADGTYRPSGDYHKLNSMTARPTFSIPHLFDFVTNLKGSKIFSKIDLCKAYYHVPMTPESRDKTTITTPFGSFCFNMMPFGLCGAPSFFMRLMTEVVHGLQNILFT